MQAVEELPSCKYCGGTATTEGSDPEHNIGVVTCTQCGCRLECRPLSEEEDGMERAMNQWAEWHKHKE